MIAGAAALAVSSCAYDPYYQGSSYSGGYGDGNGYGSSGFSSSVFISTGSPRWGYDPYAGAYYDHTRHCYYDPYLHGYYPVGYRPRYVHGAPHPHGWSHGGHHIAPPSRIRHTTLSNYHHREHRYRELGHDWSGDIRADHSGSYQGGRERLLAPEGGWRERPSRHDRHHDGPQHSPQQLQESGHGRAGSRWDNMAVVAPQPHRDPDGNRFSGGGRRVDPQQGEERMRAFQERMQQRQQRQPQPVPQTQNWSPPAPQQAAPQMPEPGRGGGFGRGPRDDHDGPGHRGRGRGRGIEALQGLGEG